MKTHLDCVPCFVRQGLRAARDVTTDPFAHEQMVRHVLRLAAELDLNRPPPFIVQAIHRRIRMLTGLADPYAMAKHRFNQLALEALPALARIVQQAEDPLLEAARCAVAANAIDTGVAPDLTETEVLSALRGLPGQQTRGDWSAFQTAAARAKDILYLADNAGEIAVDRLVIEALGPERVTVAVRGAPVLNDATREDALAVGLHALVPVIDNGSDAPGTIIEDCSSSFQHRFEDADLIIAKGQGNYETLSDGGNKVAFWFKVKCDIVSQQVGFPVGTHVLLPPGAH
jgi:damage-control phosphatase, subfamily I